MNPSENQSPLEHPSRGIVKPFRFPTTPHEYKVVALRECAVAPDQALCDTPERVVNYWRQHVPSHPYFNPEVECLVAIMVNTRRRVKGHYLVATGTLDTLLAHPREVFRLAIMVSASAIIIAHNHPSGDPTPSEADIKVTRELIRAGQLLRMEVLDHLILGSPSPDRLKAYTSLRELGYFYG